MKHTPVSEVSRVADVHAIPLKPPLTRVERLERWAEALEREPDRVLTSLEEIEWRSEDERGAMRTECSPVTVAYEDPVLRADLWAKFHEMAARGTALLVSSHVMDEAGRCDRLILIREGRLIADDTPGAVRAAAGTDDLEEAFLRLINKAEVAV